MTPTHTTASLARDLAELDARASAAAERIANFAEAEWVASYFGASGPVRAAVAREAGKLAAQCREHGRAVRRAWPPQWGLSRTTVPSEVRRLLVQAHHELVVAERGADRLVQRAHQVDWRGYCRQLSRVFQSIARAASALRTAALLARRAQALRARGGRSSPSR